VSRSILGIPTFHEPLAVHFIRARNSLILSCFSRPFLLYYTIWSDGRKEEKCEWGKIDQSLITGRMVFHILFIAIISI